MLKFNVRNQQLSRIDNFRPVEKSVNYLTAEFVFLTDDWDGTDRKAVCKNLSTGNTYDAEITDGKCLIPWEALDASGKFEICVHSVGAYPKITTAVCTVDLGRTLPSGTETKPPSPTELDVIRQEIKDLTERVDNIGDPETPGTNGEDGGYYTPSVSQADENTVKFSFTASKEGMAAVADQEITLPAGRDGVDGKDGQDGYSPVRGTDYWTDADQTAIINAVLANFTDVSEVGA